MKIFIGYKEALELTLSHVSPGITETLPLEHLVGAAEIRDLEVVKQIVERTDEQRHTTRSVDWRLDVITREGTLNLALFDTEEQAREERRQILAVLDTDDRSGRPG